MDRGRMERRPVERESRGVPCGKTAGQVSLPPSHTNNPDPGVCPQIQCIHSYLTDQVRQHVLRVNLENKGCVLQGDRN